MQGADFKVEARTCFSQAERLEPKEPRWPYFHGLLLQDESEAAIARLERAAQLCGDEPDTPRLRLAQLLAENGRFDQAERHFKELLRKRSDHAPALLGLARLSNARGRFEETANFLRPALEDVHTARSAYLLLANVQRRLGNETAAETTARVAATLPADDQWPDPYLLQTSRYQIGQQALVDRGVQLLKQGRIAEAVPTIDRVINEYPDSAEGWLLLGRLRLKQKDCASAEQAVQHHLRLDPRSANGYVQLGMAHLCQEQYSAAAASRPAIVGKSSGHERVTGPSVADNSVNPATNPTFYQLPSTNVTPRVTRTFKFDRLNGQWSINGQFMTCDHFRFLVERNSVENWILFNATGDWTHPVHIHLEEHQILSRNRAAPSLVEKSRKDVTQLRPNERVLLFFRFRDWLGKYPIHCHNVVHEDHAMMGLWDVVTPGNADTKQVP